MRSARNCSGSVSTINFDALIKRGRFEPREAQRANRRESERGMLSRVRTCARARYRVSKFNTPVPCGGYGSEECVHTPIHTGYGGWLSP